MVAIKRINVLLSTLLGCLLFNERVGRRIPAICCMLVGMLLIVLQPGHEALHQHHSHTTRLHR
jgi:drug/metabolite transporter (DMT)-like permease